MSAVSMSITIEQGATWQRQVTITDNGVPTDLTGYTARMEVRALVASDSTLIDLPSAQGSIDITPLTGVIALTLLAATTAALVPPNRNLLGPQPFGVWSLEITSGAGVVERVLEGPVSLSAEITR